MFICIQPLTLWKITCGAVRYQILVINILNVAFYIKFHVFRTVKIHNVVSGS
jgi:hypothetical protein